MGRRSNAAFRIPRSTDRPVEGTGYHLEAFESDPSLEREHRYAAACCAARASRAAGDYGEAERAAWRAHALAWLRAELAADPVNVPRWLLDADLRGVRDEEELAKLPAEERRAWTAFWEEVRSR